MVKLGDDGKRKPKKKPKPKKAKPPASKVLDAAEKIKDAADRAKFLEAAIDRVDKPAKLVEPLFDALDEFTQRDVIGARFQTLAEEGRDVDFMDEVGHQLDNSYLEEYAVPVLRAALAAGSTSKTTFETLGRLLVLRKDPGGAPLLERAVERDPQWDAPRIGLAVWLHDKDPDRALGAIADCSDWRAHELRAMIHEAAGRTREANLAQREALEEFDDDFIARKQLSDWHYEHDRYERSLMHARFVFERRRTSRRLDDYDLDDIDESIARSFRLGGAFKDIVPWLVERCAGAIPSDLAWHIYYGLTAYSPTLEPALAIRAAEACMAKETVPSDIRLWRVRIAANTSLSALEALAHEGLDDDAEAWVELADAYNAADCPDAASAAVDRALQLDPNSAGALSTMFDLALTAGDGETLHRVSEALAVVKPQWHQGPEHLGRSFARRGEAAAALVHAKRAVSLAPFCHNAWTGLAEASVVAGDLERAREATKRSLEIDDGDDDTQILNAALFAGDLEQALAERYGHLPALPFPKFVSLLRRARESL